jgi:hypothetical protein
MLPGKDPTVILHPVPVEEPDGYRGRRRRFFMTRKGGGVALPALLVGASIVVILIVIGVAQLLPRDAAGQIPVGGGNGAVTEGDGGQPGPDPVQPGSSASGSARPSRSASAPASAKPGPSPSGGVAPPAAAPPGAPPAAPTTSAPPRRQAVSVEAESAGLGGNASRFSCSSCSAGAKVRNIGGTSNGGSVTVTVTGVASAGNYPMTITYELGQPSRTFYLSVNGGAPSQVNLVSNTTDWNAPLTATVQIALGAGTNTIKFSNPTAFAPDLDKVAV